MKKLLPMVLAALGLGAGIGAGVLLRDPAEAAVAEAPPEPDAEAEEKAKATEFVSLGNQFLVPVVDSAEVSALVVLSLDLEIAEGGSDAVARLEPKLRDAFLAVLFDHANAGGFHGAFTESGTLDLLRDALRETANSTLGEPVVEKVLITDIVRQKV